MINFEETFTFDDFLLKPKFSEIKSRSEIDLSVNVGKGFSFKNCIVPANMRDIVGEELISKMYEIGSLSFLHRFSSIEEQIQILNNLKNKYGNNIFNYVGVSVGVKEEDKKNLEEFSKLGIKIVCIDIAHLDSIVGLDMVKYISSIYPDTLLIAGNVATGDAAERAWKFGADIVKVGIGASGICSTRLEAGAGVPQLSAIIDVAERRKLLKNSFGRQISFISDGGHSKNADIVKSLCFADMVMLGGMLAGTTESPGQLIKTDKGLFKSYHGSSTHKDSRVEGVKAIVKYKGSIENVMKRILEGIQSGCSYQNCRSVSQLQNNPLFVKLTNAGISESKIHDIHSFE